MDKPFFLIALTVASILFFPSAPLCAAKATRLKFKSEEEAALYLDRQYCVGARYYNEGHWRRAADAFEKVIRFFPSSEEAVEASYYLAICYFEMKEYDFANREFSNYLKGSQHPLFFEEAIHYKFCIAEHFRRGKKKRPFEIRYLPKWVSAQELALTIYDEVVVALPHHELAVRALMAKAALLKQSGDYREAIEAYQTVIRRFPRDEAAPLCYLEIADAYEKQSRCEFQNPDILALAELNVRKFKDDFPREEQVAFAEQAVCRIKEFYAKGLCDLGLFYERMKQPQAAAIYYQSAVEEFPETRVAAFCRLRLACLRPAEVEETGCPLEEEGGQDEGCSIDGMPTDAPLLETGNPMHGCQLKRRSLPHPVAHV